MDSSELSLFDLILCTLAVLQQTDPLTLVPWGHALSFMVGSVGLQMEWQPNEHLLSAFRNDTGLLLQYAGGRDLG